MNVLDRLGLAIANAGYAWTPEMRQAYEEGIKELESAVLAEREACAKVCEEGTGEAVQKTTLEILLNERKRIAKAIRDRGDE